MTFHPETVTLAHPETAQAGQRGSLSVTDCSGLTCAMRTAVELIQHYGKIEAEWRKGFNSCGRWMNDDLPWDTPQIRMVTLDALVKRGVLRIETEYTYHGHGEWCDHQVYLLCPNDQGQTRSANNQHDKSGDKS
jgi:hypothetical protein